MPTVLDHIDHIARSKQRDVLFVHFEHYLEDQALEDNSRTELLAWLDQHGIAYVPCMGLADEQLIDSYMGDIYIDVPFDAGDARYQLLQAHLEDEQGNMKIEGVLFFVLSLEVALEIEAEEKSQLQLEDDQEPDTGTNRPS